jgi:5'-methylthioadenosine phosphorylase
MPRIPRCAHAIVGGSGTAAIDFPGALGDSRVRVISDAIKETTPFGDSPPVRHIAVTLGDGSEREALVARMHGWQHGVGRHDATLALFWLLREAGVRRVIAEAGSGSITQNFRPRDLVLPHDVIDLTRQVGGQIDPGTVVLMRTPFCPEIREALWEQSLRWAADKATRAFNRAVYATTEGTRFESAAEVAAYARLDADVVGQAVSPEVYLAREIGACYAALTIVLNYAEGVRPTWDYSLLEEIVRDDARSLGLLLLEALVRLPEQARCACLTYRRRQISADPSTTTSPDTA